MSSSVSIVPVYESLGPDALAFIIRQTELTTLCVEKKGIDLIIKLKSEQDHSSLVPNLKHVISFDQVSEDDKQRAQAADLKLFNF